MAGKVEASPWESQGNQSQCPKGTSCGASTAWVLNNENTGKLLYYKRNLWVSWVALVDESIGVLKKRDRVSELGGGWGTNGRQNFSILTNHGATKVYWWLLALWSLRLMDSWGSITVCVCIENGAVSLVFSQFLCNRWRVPDKLWGKGT